MKTKLRKKVKGFTLVELVIVIAIVIVLSVVSVPIYRSYVDKAKMSEGYALAGTIIAAEKAYYSEYGNFYARVYPFTSYSPVLGVDARGNKYFTSFATWNSSGGAASNWFYVYAHLTKPPELQDNGKKNLYLYFNITSGSTLYEG